MVDGLPPAPSFWNGERKCCENVKYDISMRNFLKLQNTSRSHRRHSRDLRSSRLVNYEPILSSKSHFSKIRRNDAIEIFRWTKIQLAIVAPIPAPTPRSDLWINKSTSMNSNAILLWKSQLLKIRRNDAIEIIRFTKNQLGMIAPTLRKYHLLH